MNIIFYNKALTKGGAARSDPIIFGQFANLIS